MSVASRRLGPLRILVTVENVEAVFSGRGPNPNRDHQNTRQRMWAASAKYVGAPRSGSLTFWKCR
jgi:hypothetical protein